MAKTTEERISDGVDFHALNTMLNLYDREGRIPFQKVRQWCEAFRGTRVEPNAPTFPSQGGEEKGGGGGGEGGGGGGGGVGGGWGGIGQGGGGEKA